MKVGRKKSGRSERIRTSDPLLPKQMRYQTALRSDKKRNKKIGDFYILKAAGWQRILSPC